MQRIECNIQKDHARRLPRIKVTVSLESTRQPLPFLGFSNHMPLLPLPCLHCHATCHPNYLSVKGVLFVSFMAVTHSVTSAQKNKLSILPLLSQKRRNSVTIFPSNNNNLGTIYSTKKGKYGCPLLLIEKYLKST